MNLLKFLLIFANILLLYKVVLVTNLFSPERQMADFDNYYRTVPDIKKGINPYTVSYMQTLGPPITFVYYYPYSLFSLATAQVIFLVTNIICGFATCIVLSKKHWLFLSVILWLSFLSRYSLQIGQPSLTIAFLISLVLKNKFTHLAATGLVLIKAFLGFSLFSLKNFIPLFLVLILSLVIIKPAWTSYYLINKVGANFGRFQNATLISYENQTMLNTLARIGLANIYPVMWIVILLIGIYSVRKYHDFSLGILFSFILTPVLWQHYLVALFPIFIMSFQKKLSWSNVVSFLLWWPDLRLNFLNPFTAVLASHFYVSILLLTISFLWSPKSSSSH